MIEVGQILADGFFGTTFEADNWRESDSGNLVVYKLDSEKQERVAEFRQWAWVRKVESAAEGGKEGSVDEEPQLEFAGSLSWSAELVGAIINGFLEGVLKGLDTLLESVTPKTKHG